MYQFFGGTPENILWNGHITHSCFYLRIFLEKLHLIHTFNFAQRFATVSQFSLNLISVSFVVLLGKQAKILASCKTHSKYSAVLAYIIYCKGRNYTTRSELFLHIMCNGPFIFTKYKCATLFRSPRTPRKWTPYRLWKWRKNKGLLILYNTFNQAGNV